MFSLEKSLLLTLCFTANFILGYFDFILFHCPILGPGRALRAGSAPGEADAPRWALEAASIPLDFGSKQEPKRGRGKGEGVGNPAEEEKMKLEKQ